MAHLWAHLKRERATRAVVVAGRRSARRGTLDTRWLQQTAKLPLRREGGAQLAPSEGGMAPRGVKCVHGRRARAATVAERALPARDVHRRAAATCACARAAPWRGPLRARWSDPWHPAGATAGAALGGARARGGARRARRLCVHVPLDEAVRTSKVLAEQSSRRHGTHASAVGWPEQPTDISA